MKNNTFLILLTILFTSFISKAQDCDQLVSFAELHLKGREYTGVNYKSAYGLLDVCAMKNHPAALNLLGLMYMHGQYVDKDEDKGFDLVKRAADQGFHPAEYNLGRYYKWGKGCDIDFEQAVYWLKNSANHGNERAAYLLGYMYFKGFAVDQSYTNAIEWFEISEWPMARYWLGYCYYFGFGVPQNTEKALEILVPNKILNSQKLVAHIESNKIQKIEVKNQMELAENKIDSTSITKEAIPEKPIKIKKEINPKKISGIWKGKLIEFDWSGNHIQRVLPISVEFNYTENGVDFKWIVNNQESKDFAIWLDDALYFEKLNMVLDNPFSVNPVSDKLNWRILASHMEEKKFNNKTYITGSLDTYIEDWKEPGPPISIILKKMKGEDYYDTAVEIENIDDITEEILSDSVEEEFSEEVLLALLEQENQFIKLYPNPFSSELLIQYELNTSGNVSVKIHDLTGQPRKNIQSDVLQQTGSYTYNIEGSDLPPGLYVVNIYVDGERHSKIVIKE